MAFVLLSQKKLKGETTCSVCLDYFTTPVTLDCGHNLCQGCLEQCWGVPGTTEKPTTCPQCRQTVWRRHQKPNWQLGNLAGLAKEATIVEKHGGEESATMCQSHPGEPLLEIFCQEDQVPLCLACLRAHRGHEIIPLQETAQEAKEKIFCCMEELMKRREKISMLEICTLNESEQLLQQTKTAKQRTADQLKNLRHFLRKLERQLQDQAAEVEKEIVTRRDAKLGKLSEERASLNSTISELAKKSQQTESKLVQDVGTLLQRCENTAVATDPLTFPVELKWRNWDLFDFVPFLENVTTKFKDTLISGLHLKKG
ncbi:zinc finger protein RFP-like [Sceloporus undulatus]|uniref:zinc finger protein RFP-like n=1 Tax=Sceloporus undulatus TaxID=8520 RepID=UPI001C4D44F0|nr:zinc finger protein RFP-like [Sceloporus undulatus]